MMKKEKEKKDSKQNYLSNVCKKKKKVLKK